MTLGDLFLWPAALPLLALAPVVWLVLHGFGRRSERRLATLLGERAGVLAADLGATLRHTRRALFCVGFFLALMATLQPVWGKAAARKIEQRGVDVLVCLDVSRSMLARDLAPSRLEAARREIRALAERARGDRLGLVAFAGEARLIAPLTRDVTSFIDLVDRTDPLSVGRGGTDLGAALTTALDALTGATGDHEAVLVLTDGEDHEQRGRRAAEACRERGIVVHCVGFGTARGSKIAVVDGEGESFLRDRAGDEIISALDPASLRVIAATTGGDFVAAASEPGELVGLYEDRVLPMAHKAFESEERRERPQRYQWPLLAAMALWILELCLTDRKR